MKKIKIRFEKEYKYIPQRSKEKFQCKVVLCLPAYQQENCDYLILDESLQDGDTLCFGEELYACWGGQDKSKAEKWRIKEVSACSWKRVDAKAEALIKETVESLKKVKEKNIARQKCQPRDCELSYKI